MERASRLFVLFSTAAAFFTYQWLVVWIPGARSAALALFAIGMLLSRIHFVSSVVMLTVSSFVLPGVLPLIVKTTNHDGLVIWFGLAAGVVIGASSRQKWSAPRPWTMPLAAWVMVLAATWPIVLGRELDFSFVAAVTTDAVNGVAAGPPRVTAAWVAHSALSQLLGLLWFDLLWFRFDPADLRPVELAVVAPFIVSAVTGSIVAVYQGTVDASFMSGGLWPRMHRATGLMLDANTFGITAAICGPLAMSLAWCQNRRAWVAATVFMLLTISLWFSGSRSAIVLLSLGGVGTLVGMEQHHGSRRDQRVGVALVLAMALLGTISLVVPSPWTIQNPVQRILERVPAPDRVSFRRFIDEVWTRFGYGTAAVAMFRDHPLTGVGIGSFPVIAPDYIYRESNKVAAPDNAQNWWRHQLSELGLVGATPAIFCSMLVASLIWRARPPGGRQPAVFSLRGVLAGVGVASLVAVPVQHPAVWLLVATVIFWTMALSDPPRPTDRSAGISLAQISVAASIAAWCLAGQAIEATKALRVPVRAQRAGFPYRYGFSPPQFSSEDGDVRWTSNKAVAVLAVRQPWIGITISPIRGATADISARVRVSLDDRQVLDQSVSSSAPLTRYVSVAQGLRYVRLEVRTPDLKGEGFLLKVAHHWLRELPSTASSDIVIR